MGYGAKRTTSRGKKTFPHKRKSSVRTPVLFLPQPFTLHFWKNKTKQKKTKVEVRSAREGAVKSAASPDIHSRCWLDLVEPGPVALGAGFSCLFLQVWCLMLIPPHVPRVLSKHAGAGDSAGRPALPPCPPSSLSASSGGPTHPRCSKQASKRATGSSSPYLSSESLPFLYSFIAPFPPQISVSSLGLNPFDDGVMFTPPLHRLRREPPRRTELLLQ